MNYEFYGVAVAGLALIYKFIRDARKDNNEQLVEIKSDLKDIKADVTEVKERMAFLEAANIYTMPAEPSQPNPRSMAARKMHERRRQRKLENKDG